MQSRELLRNTASFPVCPEPVEGHLGRFDKLTASGRFFKQHALLRNNSNVSFCLSPERICQEESIRRKKITLDNHVSL
jgi:hypothetical protein